MGILLLTLVLLLLAVAGIAIKLWAKKDGKININKAPIEELAKLDRIGVKYAQRIVQYREKNGPFKKPVDITNVKGIGQKVWEVNKEKIVVE